MQTSKMIRNPILPGFYPDPSICRVGDDFYLVNSSFAFFPALPLFHSTDLVQWKQIGNVLDRTGQLPLDGARATRGLFAPTIRYNKGTFYVVCTNVDNGGNFFVSATNPEGPWSDPVWLPEAEGIDPSLFFDDDGRVWYTGTRPAPEGPAYSGNWEIWIREIDLTAKKDNFRGEAHGIWRGALRDCIWPEGPHIYRKDGFYFLFIAEGGTGMDHAITVARSASLFGPWEGKRSNPILTHRNLGRTADLINVGHSDLFDDTAGNWWLVLLASRPYGIEPRRGTNLGRETFMVPVIWEEDWPVASHRTGLVEKEYPAPALSGSNGATAGSNGATAGLTRFPFGIEAVSDKPVRTVFDQKSLPLEWIALRTSTEKTWSLSERPGYLRLYTLEANLRDLKPVSFVCRRQQHFSWKISAAFEFVPTTANESAGLALFRGEDFLYRFEICLIDGARSVRVIRTSGGIDEIVVQRAIRSGLVPGDAVKTILAVIAEGQNLAFAFGPSPDSIETLAEGVDAFILSTEKAGGFIGTVLGAYASGNGRASKNHADVAWFEYGGK